MAVMRAHVIEDVVLKAWCLANILGGYSPPRDCSSDFNAGDAATTVLLVVGCQRVGEIGFLVV